MTRKPVVIHVITRLIIGGAQLSVLALVESLREDFDVRIICGPQLGVEGSLLDAAAHLAPVTIVPPLIRDVAPRSDVAAARALRAAYDRAGTDLVHTHSSKAGIVGRVASRPDRMAVAHTVHGWGHTPEDPANRRRLFVTLERVMARRTHALVSVSDEVREEGLSLGIGKPEQYRVIPELVDYTPLMADFVAARHLARSRLAVPPDAEVVGWVGRFVEQKDPRGLAATIAIMLNRRPGMLAVLIGDGPERDQVAQALAQAGVLSRVIFTGVRPDVRGLYPAFDVLVHPSGWEGQPRVVQEALAERVPVVASNVIGLGGLIDDGITGYLVPAREAEAMAAAALRILEERAPHAPLSVSSLRPLVERFGRDRAVKEHLALYENLLRAR